MKQPFYDPTKSYEENYQYGPFGSLAETPSLTRIQQPKFTFFGQRVYTSFGIPAGPLLNSQFVGAAFRQGFDICTYKTVRTQPYACHPAPNILAVKIEGDLTPDKAAQPVVADIEYRAPLSITNSFGVPSMAPDVWQPDMAKALAAAGPGQVMIGSFQGTRQAGSGTQAFVQDYVLAAKLVKETGAEVLEANLSCPNEGTASLVCFDIERVQSIVEAIKNEIGDTPLILKLGYFTSDTELAKLIKAIGGKVDGLAAINTIPAQIVNHRGEPALPGEGRLISGVCGASIQWAGLDMVGRLKKLRQQLHQDFTIIGVGGVMSADDATRYLKAGADVVQSATGAMWHPDLGKQVYERFYEV